MFSAQWFKDGFLAIAFAFGFLALWCLWGALVFPILRAFELLGETWFIPYAEGAYLHLSGASQWIPPLSVLGLASVPFSNVPNSLWVFAWVFIFSWHIFILFFDKLPSLPKRYRKGKTREELFKASLRSNCRGFLIYSAVLGVLCVPGLMTYEVLYDGSLRYKSYFSFHEQSKSLSDLREVRRYTYGKANSYIGWYLKFQDGGIYDLNGPPAWQALDYLLSLPDVTSNVVIRNGRLFLKPA